MHIYSSNAANAGTYVHCGVEVAELSAYASSYYCVLTAV